MTSATVTTYIIRDLRDQEVLRFDWNYYCKPKWDLLWKFIPYENFTIQSCGYDEEEEYWENEPMSLDKFMNDLKKKEFPKL